MNEPNYGPCCACGGTDCVRNVICLDFEGPANTYGWGCVVCGIPARGAVALVCDRCAEEGAEPRFICGGKGASDAVRISLQDYPRVPFGHVLAKHPEVARQ